MRCARARWYVFATHENLLGIVPYMSLRGCEAAVAIRTLYMRRIIHRNARENGLLHQFAIWFAMTAWYRSVYVIARSLSDRGNPFSLYEAYHSSKRKGKRIASPVCELVRNDSMVSLRSCHCEAAKQPRNPFLQASPSASLAVPPEKTNCHTGARRCGNDSVF